MDAVILARLDHSSPEKRLSTMLELKQSVQDKGHLLIANVKKLFLIMKERLLDVDREVTLASFETLIEIIPRFGPDLKNYFVILLSTLIQSLGRSFVKDLSLQALKSFASRHDGYDTVFQALIRVGMDDDDTLVRKECASAVTRLLSEEVNLNSGEYKKIVEGLVRRLRDVDENVVLAATHALGHLRGHIGEDLFGVIVKKLSFAHQQLIKKKDDIIHISAERLKIERNEARLSKENERNKAQFAREAELERFRAERDDAEMHLQKERQSNFSSGSKEIYDGEIDFVKSNKAMSRDRKDNDKYSTKASERDIDDGASLPSRKDKLSKELGEENIPGSSRRARMDASESKYSEPLSIVGKTNPDSTLMVISSSSSRNVSNTLVDDGKGKGELPAKVRVRKRSTSDALSETGKDTKIGDSGGSSAIDEIRKHQMSLGFDLGITGSTLESKRSTTKPGTASSSRSEKNDVLAHRETSHPSSSSTGFELNLDFGITGSTVDLGSARRVTPRKLSGKQILEFGFIPSTLYSKLNDSTAWKVRASAIEELQEVTANINDINPIVPQISSLFQFLGNLLMDTNFKISVTSLHIVGVLIDKLGGHVKGHLGIILPSLIEKLGDSKRIIQQDGLEVFAKMLSATDPQIVIHGLLKRGGGLQHRNWMVRENSLRVLMQAMLTCGENWNMDVPSLVKYMAPLLLDKQVKTRLAAMDAFAVLRHVATGVMDLWHLLAEYGVEEDSTIGEQLKARLSMPDSCLPIVNSSGVVESNVDILPITPKSVTPGSHYESPSGISSTERPRRHPSAGRNNAKKIPWDISSTPTKAKHRGLSSDSPTDNRSDVGSDAERNTNDDALHSSYLNFRPGKLDIPNHENLDMDTYERLLYETPHDIKRSNSPGDIDISNMVVPESIKESRSSPTKRIMSRMSPFPRDVQESNIDALDSDYNRKYASGNGGRSGSKSSYSSYVEKERKAVLWLSDNTDKVDSPVVESSLASNTANRRGVKSATTIQPAFRTKSSTDSYRDEVSSSLYARGGDSDYNNGIDNSDVPLRSTSSFIRAAHSLSEDNTPKSYENSSPSFGHTMERENVVTPQENVRNQLKLLKSRGGSGSRRAFSANSALTTHERAAAQVMATYGSSTNVKAPPPPGIAAWVDEGEESDEPNNEVVTVSGHNRSNSYHSITGTHIRHKREPSITNGEKEKERDRDHVDIDIPPSSTMNNSNLEDRPIRPMRDVSIYNDAYSSSTRNTPTNYFSSNPSKASLSNNTYKSDAVERDPRGGYLNSTGGSTKSSGSSSIADNGRKPHLPDVYSRTASILDEGDIFDIAKPNRRANTSKSTRNKPKVDYEEVPRRVETASTPKVIASTPSNLSSDTSYLTSAQIMEEGLRSPEMEYKSMTEGFKTGDWMRQFEAVNSVRKLSLHAPHLLIGNLHQIIIEVLKALDNLRSSVSKNAILAFNDMFNGLQKNMDSDLDTIMIPLIKKSADTSGFLCEEADRAMSAMLANVSSSKALTALMGVSSHRNAQIRAKAAYYIDQCVSGISNITVMKECDNLVKATAKFLGEAAYEARVAGKSILFQLSAAGALDEHTLGRLLTDHEFNVVKDTLAKGSSGTYNPAGVLGNTGGGKTRSSVAKVARSSSRSKVRSKTPHNGGGDAGGGDDVSNPELNILPNIFTNLSCSDWKLRYDALEDLSSLMEAYPRDLRRWGVKIIDSVTSRLNDGNSKVNLLALKTACEMVPTLQNDVKNNLHSLLSAAASNVASSNPQIAKGGTSLVDVIIRNIDSNLVIDPLCKLITQGNVRNQPTLMTKLLEILPKICESKSSLITRHVIPTYIEMQSSKGEAQTINERILRVLRNELGSDNLVDMISSMPLNKQNTMKIALGL